RTLPRSSRQTQPAPVDERLVGATVVWMGIWAFLTYVPPVQRFGKKHPWWMTLLVLAFLTGAIVIITIIDNANIAAREAKYAQMDENPHENGNSSAKSDSLRKAWDDSVATVRASEKAARDRESFLEDSLRQAKRDAEYAAKPVKLIVANPELDTMFVYVNDEKVFKVNPHEVYGKNVTRSDSMLVKAMIGKKTLDTLLIRMPYINAKNYRHSYFFNPKSKWSFAFLDFSAAFKKGGSEYPLLWSAFRIKNMHLTWNATTLTMTRKTMPSIAFDRQVKIVRVPNDWKEKPESDLQSFAIYKLNLDHSRGFMQDGMDFFMLSKKERRKWIKNRLSREIKDWKAQ
ncbi:MAG: hypothetical protein AAF570_28035, partial [Bacteroidota bacterium]